MTKITHTAESCSIDRLVGRAGVEREALGMLYDETYPAIFRYCVRRTGNRSLAEDLASSVFLSVAANMKSFMGSTYVDFRRWVFTIATNEINANHRKTVRRRALLIDAANAGRLQGDGSNEQAAMDRSDTLQAAIMRLEERAQSIVTMRFISELSYEDIGQVLGISPGAARTAASRALEQVRNDMRSE